MKKLKLELDDLVVESFVTSETAAPAGTVLAQGSTVASEPECTCVFTCDATCPNTCWPGCNPPNPTEPGFNTCGGETCDNEYCGPTRVDCPPTYPCVSVGYDTCYLCGGGGWTEGQDCQLTDAPVCY